ncbi:hypothetical protein [Vibrio sp. HN007]|uniref:hypothetical protein n=1 Tax=Vibrio iocasae TaxID=3098914 RepID=UPI0035D4D446
MEKDKNTIQWLNLVSSSPMFVIKVGKEHEASKVVAVALIPKNDGEYWVAGETVFKNGMKVPSVFRVDTDAGGSLMDVYWKINSDWWDYQNRPYVYDALELPESELFPFDWSYAVNLEDDNFHPSH